ncbi:hypothetical protein SAMN04487894_104102 [Niabella drilacis]|uniref:Alpha/beta hydrolase n=2 Tax=Niabella drilacis (strain DSM 25811 / CCM 8410 / CCUG 62505 / LMG 26954 / E90) TaxID=1285928 RepID=A0A1G6PN08_NIADE|nr:hypothetical protein SAMN04487894_104102 [Niabella drilacis]
MTLLQRCLPVFVFVLWSCPAAAQSAKVPDQYPSPMQETTRRHKRIAFDVQQGITYTIDSVLAKPVFVYIPNRLKKAAWADLLIHFHGLNYVPAYTAEKSKTNLIAVSVNLGSGSGAYARPFQNDTVFKKLVTAIWNTVQEHMESRIRQRKIILSGFSAGYGAIRSILSDADDFASVNTILLLDGLHASYIPERKVLAEGGLIDSIGLEPFLAFARKAVLPVTGKQMLFTHSEIFPGTFVSTTEAADYLLLLLQLKAIPVLKEGPGGMQQISEADKGNFKVLGFAGNSAPDHVDHFHGLPFFLRRLL